MTQAAKMSKAEALSPIYASAVAIWHPHNSEPAQKLSTFSAPYVPAIPVYSKKSIQQVN